MRAFQITPEFQDLYKYPSLTTELKAGIFGLNAAELFGIDPVATRCALSTDPLTANIDETAQLRHDGALHSPWLPHGPTTRRQMFRWLASSPAGWVPT